MATYMLLLYAEDADEQTRAERWAELPEWEALTERAARARRLDRERGAAPGRVRDHGPGPGR
jgi:hypothetical protein